MLYTMVEDVYKRQAFARAALEMGPLFTIFSKTSRLLMSRIISWLPDIMVITSVKYYFYFSIIVWKSQNKLENLNSYLSVMKNVL